MLHMLIATTEQGDKLEEFISEVSHKLGVGVDVPVSEVAKRLSCV